VSPKVSSVGILKGSQCCDELVEHDGVAAHESQWHECLCGILLAAQFLRMASGKKNKARADRSSYLHQLYGYLDFDVLGSRFEQRRGADRSKTRTQLHYFLLTLHTDNTHIELVNGK